MCSVRYLAPVFLGAILTLAATDLRPAVAQDSIGRTRVVVQTVTGETDAVRRRLAVRDNVFREELIRTELDSASVIRFVDRTRLTLGPNARLILDKAVFDPTPGRGVFVLSAVQGVFRFLSGGLDSSAYEIRTPTVSIGVRGTMFAGVVAPDGTTVVILQSPDEVTVRHRTSGERVTLVSHGDSTTAYPDGVLTEPGPAPGWARALLLEMDDLLRIDPIHIERDDLEAVVIEASAAPAVSPTTPMGPPPETPAPDQVSEPTPIVAPDKLPPAPEPPEPPLTVSEARALERARTVAAGPAQTGGLARADDHADERAEGSRDHGNGDRDGSDASSQSSGPSETASASAGPSQSSGGGQGSSADDGQTTSSGGKNDSNGTSRRGRSDRGGKGDGKGSGGKGKNRR